jgi:hypothetical protein
MPSGCKPLSVGTMMTVPTKEAPANYVPAAAVIRREQALSGFIGRKELIGCLESRMSNPRAQPATAFETTMTRVW